MGVLGLMNCTCRPNDVNFIKNMSSAMKKNKLVIFAIAIMGMLVLSQSAVSVETGKLEVHPTAWTRLELKGAAKDLGSKIAAQITANPKNAAALVAALVAANPDHADAITAAAVVTLDTSFAASITAAAVNASPSSAAAITAAAISAAPSSAANIAKAAVSASPSSAVTITAAAVRALPSAAAAITKATVSASPTLASAITTAAVSVVPQSASAIVVAVVGLISNSAERNFSQSEATTANSSVKQNVITTALENTIKGCTDDQCKINAAVTAVKQGGNSPDLAALAGAVINTVISNSPKDPNLEQNLAKELKVSASPS